MPSGHCITPEVAQHHGQLCTACALLLTSLDNYALLWTTLDSYALFWTPLDYFEHLWITMYYYLKLWTFLCSTPVKTLRPSTRADNYAGITTDFCTQPTQENCVKCCTALNLLAQLFCWTNLTEKQGKLGWGGLGRAGQCLGFRFLIFVHLIYHISQTKLWRSIKAWLFLLFLFLDVWNLFNTLD